LDRITWRKLPILQNFLQHSKGLKATRAYLRRKGWMRHPGKIVFLELRCDFCSVMTPWICHSSKKTTRAWGAENSFFCRQIGMSVVDKI
jgi:hypothetical protein